MDSAGASGAVPGRKMGKAWGGMNFSQPMLHVKTDHTRHNQHVGLISMRFITIQHFGFLAPPMKHCSMIYNEFWVLPPKEWDFSCQDGLREGNTVPCFHAFGWLLRGSFPHPSENADGQELLVAGTGPETLEVVPSHWRSGKLALAGRKTT